MEVDEEDRVWYEVVSLSKPAHITRSSSSTSTEKRSSPACSAHTPISQLSSSVASCRECSTYQQMALQHATTESKHAAAPL